MPNKYQGLKRDYAPIRDDGSRTVISYGLKKVNEKLYEWNEVSLYKKQTPQITFEVVKKAIIDDINAKAGEKILSGFVWNGKPVWLSIENQLNFANAERHAAFGGNLPLSVKIGEDNGAPVYHEFDSAEALVSFWNACLNHIRQCHVESWAEKDGIDWKPYMDFFATTAEVTM